VLKAIGELGGRGSPPSNREIAIAAGITDEGQASKLLKRLEELGPIKSTARDRTPGEANAWRLTALGVEVERALRAKSGM